MRTEISTDNPFYHEPNFAFGYARIQAGIRLLDYGCFDCRFGKKLLLHKNVDYYGVDKNADVVAQQDPTLHVSIATHPLSFSADVFDVVVAFEVLEHIADQEKVLRELHRVLTPSGILILSVPRKHVFSFLDLGNWKFIFPGLHHLYYRMKHSEEEYMSRYKNSPNGLVGDVEQEKRWHQHFRDEEMIALLDRTGFQVLEMDAVGFFSLPMTLMSTLFGMSRLFTQRIRSWDSYRFSSRQLICSARKKGD